RLRRVDACQVDSDAVVVAAGAADLRLADVEGVDTLVDHRNGSLLHVGAALARREVGERVIDVSTAGQVQALVEVKLPAAEVGRQTRQVALQWVMVREAIDVTGAVDEQRKHKDGDHEQADGPAEDYV